jgi:hypothetical protein
MVGRCCLYGAALAVMTSSCYTRYIEDGYSKMATILAPDGHQLGGCYYVYSALQKWTNRQWPSTADITSPLSSTINGLLPLSFIPLPPYVFTAYCLIT